MQQLIMISSIILIYLAALLAQISDNHAQVLNGLPYQQPKGAWNGKLTMDTAFINITSSAKTLPFNVSGVSDNCYECDYQLLRANNEGHTYIIVETTFTFYLKITNKLGHHCFINRSFVEYGKYEITVGQLDSFSCGLVVQDENRDDKTYRPIFIAIGALAGLAVVWYLLALVWRKYHLGARIGICTDHESLINADLGSPNHLNHRSMSPSDDSDRQLKKEKPVKQKRLKSLDTFRGIALTIMIFVNYGGGGYYFFHHSRWNGLTVADLVFPWFMWIMGVSITLSFHSLRRRQTKTLTIVVKIIRRTAILFLLGVFTSNLGNLDTYRVPGVLQRFAACYCVVALVQVLASPSEDLQPKGVWWDAIRDIVCLWSQWCFMIILLATYVIVTYAVKIDDCPIGYTGPGGIGRDSPTAYNCTGGVAAKIDHKIFGNHVYQKGTFKDLYRVTVYHDPEGALGTLTSIFLVFLGVQAGSILYTYPSHRARVLRWLTWSVALGCLAIGLSGGTKNEGVVPINKNLWSVSFIFATGAMAFILLSMCYILIDVYGIWNGSPFIFPGMNSIAVYCGSELLGEHFPFSWNLDPYHTHGEELLMNIVGTGSWILVAFYMFSIDFFVKI